MGRKIDELGRSIDALLFRLAGCEDEELRARACAALDRRFGVDDAGGPRRL